MSVDSIAEYLENSVQLSYIKSFSKNKNFLTVGKVVTIALIGFGTLTLVACIVSGGPFGHEGLFGGICGLDLPFSPDTWFGRTMEWIYSASHFSKLLSLFQLSLGTILIGGSLEILRRNTKAYEREAYIEAREGVERAEASLQEIVKTSRAKEIIKAQAQLEKAKTARRKISSVMANRLMAVCKKLDKYGYDLLKIEHELMTVRYELANLSDRDRYNELQQLKKELERKQLLFASAYEGVLQEYVCATQREFMNQEQIIASKDKIWERIENDYKRAVYAEFINAEADLLWVDPDLELDTITKEQEEKRARILKIYQRAEAKFHFPIRHFKDIDRHVAELTSHRQMLRFLYSPPNHYHFNQNEIDHWRGHCEESILKLRQEKDSRIKTARSIIEKMRDMYSEAKSRLENDEKNVEARQAVCLCERAYLRAKEALDRIHRELELPKPRTQAIKQEATQLSGDLMTKATLLSNIRKKNNQAQIIKAKIEYERTLAFYYLCGQEAGLTYEDMKAHEENTWQALTQNPQ